jgi:hypothetical protein
MACHADIDVLIALSAWHSWPGLRLTLYFDRLRSRKLVFTVSFLFIAATWLFPFVVRGVGIDVGRGRAKRRRALAGARSEEAHMVDSVGRMRRPRRTAASGG